MALNMKILDKLGMVTLVTPPSMMNPEKISFTLINLKEKEKDQEQDYRNNRKYHWDQYEILSMI